MFSKRISIFIFCLLLSAGSAIGQIKAGDRAPVFGITDWIANVPKDKDTKGKFIIIDFWATWCAPCLESVPHMNELAEKYKSEDNLAFFALTDEEQSKVASLLKRIPFSSIVVSDVTRSTLKAFNIKNIPTCVIIDDRGVVKWVGHSTKLTSNIIDKILKRENPESVSFDTKYTKKEASKITDSLEKRYGAYFMDDQITEYFAFGPLTAEKWVMKLNTPYKIIVIGLSLKDQFSEFLHVSNAQLVLPDKISKALISYIYKTKKEMDYKVLMKLVLERLNLKIRTVDSLMPVMQISVVDKKLFKKEAVNADFKPNGSSSWTDTYAAISNQPFFNLKSHIENALNMLITLKNDGDFKQNMSLTVKIDSLDNLKSSLSAYGLDLNPTTQKMRVYVFEPTNKGR